LSAAVARETLRLDDRSCVQGGRDVHVGDVLVLDRLRDQQRGMAAKGRFHVPAGDVAAHPRCAGAGNRRENEKDDAHQIAAALQKVAEFRQLGGRLARRQLRESALPIVAAAQAKAPGQEVDHAVDVAFVDLTGPHLGNR